MLARRRGQHVRVGQTAVDAGKSLAIYVASDVVSDWMSGDALEGDGELTARLEATGWGELRYAGSRSWTLECNWKVYVDNFLDGGYPTSAMIWNACSGSNLAKRCARTGTP